MVRVLERLVGMLERLAARDRGERAPDRAAVRRLRDECSGPVSIGDPLPSDGYTVTSHA